MSSILKNYFPMIRERQAVIDEINHNTFLSARFNTWTLEEQKKFLDYCTGERGMKITYDPFFKEIFEPDYNPERLNNMLSSIFGQQVVIIKVLSNDGARISSETSLLITDILVQLEDGGLVNVEIQKIGYAFPGERASCYSADLLLREYRRLRDKNKRKFRYSDIKPVYTIVIFEESPNEIRKAKDYYIHRSEISFDTGINVNLLQKYIFISLDNFREIMHNRFEAIKSDAIKKTSTDDKGINEADTRLFHNKLEEWLMFLSFDEPEYIEQLVTHNPYFKELYADIYDMCLNTERLMEMYSKELAELDRNTVTYMIDELKAEVDILREERDKTITEIDNQKAKLDSQKAKLDSQKAELDSQKAEIDKISKERDLANNEIQRLKDLLSKNGINA